MMYIERIKVRLQRLRRALNIAKEQNKFDVCLRLEGQILAYESVYIDLLDASQSITPVDEDKACDHKNARHTSAGWYCPDCGEQLI